MADISGPGVSYSAGASPYDAARKQAVGRINNGAQQNIEAMQRKYAAMGNLNSGSAIAAQSQVQQRADEAGADAVNAINGQEIGEANQRNFAGNEASLQRGEAQKARDLQSSQFQQQFGFSTEQAKIAQQNRLRQFDQADKDFEFRKQTHADELGREMYNENQNDNFFSGRNVGKMTGGALGAGLGALAAWSDENLKHDIELSGPQISEFLDSVNAVKYEYNDKAHGEGTQYGVIAQDLEKTPVGKSMVIDTPEGKMIDFAKGFAILLASQSHLNKRLNELERSK